MQQNSNLRTWLLMAATLGPAGSLPFARIWLSCIGVIFVYFGRPFFSVTSIASWSVIGVVVGAMVGISAYVRSWVTSVDQEGEKKIVLDRIAGIIISLLFLHTTIKFSLFGFAVFHLWLIGSAFAQKMYGGTHRLLPAADKELSTGEIALVAVFANCALRFLWWVTH